MANFLCEMTIHPLSGTDAIIIDILIVIIILAAIISYYGKKKEIGLINSFLISVFFTPIVGIIAVLLSEKLIKCNNCGSIYKSDHNFCPSCNKNQDVFTKEELEEEIRRLGDIDYFDKEAKIKDMERETGFYWVKYLGEWIICQFTITGDWNMPGSHSRLDDTDFDQIDKEVLKRG